jgi:serine/threonine-protein kinase
VRLNVSAGQPSTTSKPKTTPNTPSKPKPKTVPAPNLVGETLASARRILLAHGLRIEVRYVPSGQPAGTVLGQSPRPGATVQRGAVFVTVSKGKPQPTGVLVPDVVGEDEQSATADLQTAGFTVSTNSQTTSDPAQDGTVVSQQPSGGTRASKDSTVTITVAHYEGG